MHRPLGAGNGDMDADIFMTLASIRISSSSVFGEGPLRTMPRRGHGNYMAGRIILARIAYRDITPGFWMGEVPLILEESLPLKGV